MKGVLNNCVNNVAVTTTAASTGGFAAYAYKNAVFNNCENKAAVSSSKDAVAGFAANAEDDVYFNNSVNSGKVAYTGTSTSARNVAGPSTSSRPATRVLSRVHRRLQAS